jgi:hypothetical protein
LINGGFEAAEGGSPGGWRSYGGTLQQVDTPVHGGGFAACLHSATTSTKWAYQTVRVEPSAWYELTAYVYSNDPEVDAAWLRISWYADDTASGSALSTADSTDALNTQDPSYRFLTTGPAQAPPVAHSANARLMLRPRSSSPTTICADDISFVIATPPPAATETPTSTPSPTEVVSGDPPTATPTPPRRATSTARAPAATRTSRPSSTARAPTARGTSRPATATRTTRPSSSATLAAGAAGAGVARAGTPARVATPSRSTASQTLGVARGPNALAYTPQPSPVIQRSALAVEVHPSPARHDVPPWAWVLASGGAMAIAAGAATWWVERR